MYLIERNDVEIRKEGIHLSEIANMQVKEISLEHIFGTRGNINLLNCNLNGIDHVRYNVYLTILF